MSQILYFRALAEELNFTKAAKRCGVSQPALTRSIQLLEEEFGGRLFRRERRHTHLSELGLVIRPHLDQIFDQAAVAKAHARRVTRLEAARLKLGVMCTVGPTELVDLIVGLRTRHPGVALEVVDATIERLDADLRRGDLDVAILCSPENAREPHLHYQPLFREPFVIVVGPSHRFAALRAVRVTDISRESYLRRINCEFGEVAGRAFREGGATYETIYRSDRDDWILAMAAAGVGFAFMPKRSVLHPGVVAIPLIEPEFWREVSLVTVRGRPHSAAVGALVHEAMRTRWADGSALAVQKLVSERS